MSGPPFASFDDWFVAQFGKRPSKRDLGELREEIKSERIHLQVLEDELAELEDWHHMRHVTLYAWRVQDKDKQCE